MRDTLASLERLPGVRDQIRAELLPLTRSSLHEIEGVIRAPEISPNRLAISSSPLIGSVQNLVPFRLVFILTSQPAREAAGKGIDHPSRRTGSQAGRHGRKPCGRAARRISR